MNTDSLVIKWDDDINDEMLSGMVWLRELTIGQNNQIGDNGLVGLTRLEKLSLPWNNCISSKGLEQLPSLTSLNLVHNTWLSVYDLPVTRLKELCISHEALHDDMGKSSYTCRELVKSNWSHVNIMVKTSGSDTPYPLGIIYKRHF